MPISLRNTRFYNDPALRAYFQLDGNSTPNELTSSGVTTTDTNIVYKNVYGKFVSGALFDGSTSKIVLGGVSQSLSPTGSFTVTVWINTTLYDNGYHEILGNTTQTGIYYAGFEFRMRDTGKIQFFMGNKTNLTQGSGYQYVDSTININTGQWTLLCCRYDGTNMQVFINGTPASSPVAYASAPVYDERASSNARLGCNNYVGTTEIQFWLGNIDDVSMFWRALSDAEILELYTSSFDSSPLWYDTNWKYRKKLTMQAPYVTGSHINIPLLISASDSDLSAKALANGNDILFADEYGNKLGHEFLTCSVGSILGYVNALTASADSKIYMYYGNPTAVNQQDSASVWSNSYVAVYHTSQVPSNLILDSTINGYHMTPYNMSSTSLISGTIWKSLTFTGNPQYCNTSALIFPRGNITIDFWNNVVTSVLGSAFSLAGTGVIQSHCPWSDNNVYWDYGDQGSGRISCNYTSYLNKWTYVTLTSAGTADNQGPYHQIYLNSTSSAFNTNNLVPAGTATSMDIGRWATFYWAPFYYVGNIEEFRISSVARTQNWVTTQYNNFVSSSYFWQFGTEESFFSGFHYSMIGTNKLKGVTIMRFN